MSTLDDVPWATERGGQARALLAAAVGAFATQGFHATTSREIAAAAGMSPAGMYVHFESKADLLAVISLSGHRAALDVVERGLTSGSPTVERLASTIGSLARWHAEHQLLARVSQNELAALPVEARRQVDSMRRRTEGLVRADVDALRAAGRSDVTDVRSTSRALLSICIDVSRWYAPRGRDRPGSVESAHAELARRLLRPG